MAIEALRNAAEKMLVALGRIDMLVESYSTVMDDDGDTVVTVNASATVKGAVNSYPAHLVGEGSDSRTFLQTEDIEVLVPDKGLGFRPEPRETRVTFEGKTRTVEKADAIYAGSAVALWRLTVR